jgi:hypothetical protein
LTLYSSEHIEDIAVLARQVREKITKFSFKYKDVSYDAKNDATKVTNDGIILLSKSLPNLKFFELPGTWLITDDGLIGLIQNCSQMRSIEVTGTSGNGGVIEGKALDQLRAHPEWVPGLKSLLLVDNEKSKVFMTAMREMSRARPELTISLVSRSEEKNYGDWDLKESSKHFRNGRKSTAKPKSKVYKPYTGGFKPYTGGQYGPFYGRW